VSSITIKNLAKASLGSAPIANAAT